MEDLKKRKEQTPEGRIIDLTSTMEIQKEVAPKIINLTEVLQAQSAKAALQPAPSVAPALVDAPAPEAGAKRSENIEKDVDAAFDVIQAERTVDAPAAAEATETVALDRGAELDDAAAESGNDLESAPAVAEPEEEVPAQEMAAPDFDEKEIESSSLDTPVEEDTAQLMEEEGLSDDTLDFSDLDVSELDVCADEGETGKGAEPACEEAEPDLMLEDMAVMEDDSSAIMDQIEPQSGVEASADDEFDSDETIELTDAVLSPDLAEVQEAAQADDIEEFDEIELTDKVDVQEFEKIPDAPADQIAPIDEADLDEEFIELIDVADAGEMSIPAAEEAPEEVGALPDQIEADEWVAAQPAPEMDAEDEDTIELIDIVDPSELVAMRNFQEDEMAPFEDDETIELTDIVDPSELAAIRSAQMGETPPDDDDAIELTDVVDPAEVAAALKYSETKLADDEDEDEDEVIELMDRIEHDPASAAPGGDRSIPEQAAPSPAALSDQVIHLDSIIEHVRKNKEKLVQNIALGVEEALVMKSLGENGEEDIEMDPKSIKQDEGASIPLGGEALENAIENIIRVKYGQTIEQLIAKTVEKVVTREIESLKRNLMEDKDLIDD